MGRSIASACMTCGRETKATDLGQLDQDSFLNVNYSNSVRCKCGTMNIHFAFNHVPAVKSVQVNLPQ